MSKEVHDLVDRCCFYKAMRNKYLSLGHPMRDVFNEEISAYISAIRDIRTHGENIKFVFEDEDMYYVARLGLARFIMNDLRTAAAFNWEYKRGSVKENMKLLALHMQEIYMFSLGLSEYTDKFGIKFEYTNEKILTYDKNLQIIRVYPFIEAKKHLYDMFEHYRMW